MAEDNSVMVVAILAVIASLAAAGISYYSAISVVPKISAYASSSGTANLSVESLAVINFSDANINWGSGKVDIGKTHAYLDTRSGTVTNGNWTPDTGLVLDNIGNVNVSLALKVGKTAAQFLGGTSPAYKWLVRNADTEPGACVNVTALDVFTDTTTSDTTFCNPLQFYEGNNTIRIDINLSVPYDSHKGALSDVVTATGTAV